ncbi:hypothetical protein Sjap_019965 [Stephania japonica]|uniref:Uncharacterized protein n=1 Tax=Stephania japonica TaxID=461633 RepID=A0AAP0EZU0_9MAGN
MCYLYSYSSDPQFHMICKAVYNVFVSMICTLCSVVLIRSAVGSLVPKVLEPCAYGVSDYKWSMGVVVVSQLVTVIVAGLAHFLDSLHGHEMSTISLVLVARITDISIPSSLSGSLLLSSLTEVFKGIQFVDRKMSPTFENKKKTKLAEALLKSDKFNSHLPPRIMKKYNTKTSESQSQLAQAIEIIRGLKRELPADYVQEELAIIHGIHTEPPKIVECHPEECEKRIKLVLKILGKIEPIKGLIPWSFPQGTTISHLISEEGPAMKSFLTVAGSIHGIGKDCGYQSDSTTAQAEIIQIE